MKTLGTLFMILLMAVSVSQSAFAGDETQNRNLKDFNAVKVSAGIDLYLTMGTTEEVKVVADEDIINDLKTEVEGHTLRIYMKNKNNWFNWTGNQTKKVYVTVKELVELGASSGSDVRTENTLDGEKLEVNVSSGADVKLDLHYKDFSVNTSSGSDAELRGKVKYLHADASSGSNIDADGLESVTCQASASSGADVSVNVSDELNANASSGGDIVYYGNPGRKDINESSGGDVRKK